MGRRWPEHGTAGTPERFRFIVGLMGPGLLEKSKTIHGRPWYGTAFSPMDISTVPYMVIACYNWAHDYFYNIDAPCMEYLPTFTP